MKEQQKEKWIRAWRRIGTYFAMYALLPLLCGAFAGFLLYINSVGEAHAEAVFAELGDKSLKSVVGAESVPSDAKIGYYFLSSEISPPIFSPVGMSVGTAKYFTVLPSDPPVTENEIVLPEKEPPSEEEKPSVIYPSLPENAIPVIRADLSSPAFFINTTNYNPNPDQIREEPYPVETDKESRGPLVLVLHTHGTECYLEDDTNLSDFAEDGVETYFDEDTTSFRTEDPEKSVVRVGKVFSDTLNHLGIPTLHCTVMHDKEDFNSAYTMSAETVKEMLRLYPSIRYVIDLHRDSVVRGDAYVKSYTEIDGTPSAQVMLVVGTNQNGNHPNWRQNLVVATAWKDTMDRAFPSLSRSLYLRTSRFNQEYLPGCLLLEVGSCANTLEEAENAARFAAEAFSQMIAEKQ